MFNVSYIYVHICGIVLNFTFCETKCFVYPISFRKIIFGMRMCRHFAPVSEVCGGLRHSSSSKGSSNNLNLAGRKYKMPEEEYVT